MKMRWRNLILTLVVIVLFGTLCFGAIAVYEYNNKPIQYPGTGVYDLSKYYPYSVEGDIDEENPEVLEIVFFTDSTKIKVKNTATSNVTVYLYDTSDESNRAIGVFSLDTGEKKEFTNLTAARHYRIGVESTERKYGLIISD